MRTTRRAVAAAHESQVALSVISRRRNNEVAFRSKQKSWQAGPAGLVVDDPLRKSGGHFAAMQKALLSSMMCDAVDG